jgi:hypothetical protein
MISAEPLLGGTFLKNFIYKLDPQSSELHMARVGGNDDKSTVKAGPGVKAAGGKPAAGAKPGDKPAAGTPGNKPGPEMQGGNEK